MQQIEKLAKHNWLIRHTLNECREKNMSQTRTLTRLIEALAKENHSLHLALTERVGVCNDTDDCYLQQVVNRAIAKAG